MATWVGMVKNSTFSYKRVDFSVIVNISVKTLWCHAIDTIFVFFLSSISFKSYCFSFSLFFAWHDQHFIMFKDSNVFKFTNFSFKTKYNNTVHGKATYEWPTDDIWVTYRWHTSTYEWHTDDIRVHTDDIRVHTSDIGMTY